MPPTTDATASAMSRVPKRLDLRRIFTHQPPHVEQVPLYIELREAAYDFAITIDRLVPDGADKTAAIRKVREALMTANAGIALDGILEVVQS